MDPGPLIFLGLTVALGWFLLIRPQRKRRQEHTGMLERMRVDDEIVTAGGLYGRVLAVEEEDVRVEIAPGTAVRVAKGAIAGITTEQGAPEPDSAGRAQS